MSKTFIGRFFQKRETLQLEYVPTKPYSDEAQMRWSPDDIFLGETNDSGEQTGTKPRTESGDNLD